MNATDRLLLETRDMAREFKTGIHMVPKSLPLSLSLSLCIADEDGTCLGGSFVF